VIGNRSASDDHDLRSPRCPAPAGFDPGRTAGSRQARWTAVAPERACHVYGVSGPFDCVGIAVSGGELTVARAGSPPGADVVVVLAVHGMTGSHVVWQPIARALDGVEGVCLLAPDLRGRGGSATLPRPYGIAAHVADLLAVLDHAGTGRAVLVGHSIGAHFVARLAAEHPARVAGVVLLDGGLPVLPIPGDWDEDLEARAAPAVDRMDAVEESLDDYVARWHTHPALVGAWNADIEAYVRYDMTDDGCGVRCVVSEEAVVTDGVELMLDGETRTAIMRVHAPIWLLRAPRGLFDDDHPVIAPSAREAFVAARPEARVEDVAGANHYTLVLGDGPGPLRAAAAIAEAVRGARVSRGSGRRTGSRPSPS
jgi:lipase